MYRIVAKSQPILQGQRKHITCHMQNAEPEDQIFKDKKEEQQSTVEDKIREMVKMVGLFESY